jgi:hypothetical protein
MSTDMMVKIIATGSNILSRFLSLVRGGINTQNIIAPIVHQSDDLTIKKYVVPSPINTKISQ